MSRFIMAPVPALTIFLIFAITPSFSREMGLGFAFVGHHRRTDLTVHTGHNNQKRKMKVGLDASIIRSSSSRLKQQQQQQQEKKQEQKKQKQQQTGERHSHLYPASAPYKNGTLEVSSLHTLSYSCYGNPSGEPALFLHGGPGAGTFPNHARFFDPEYYNIILLNQRGSGGSTPAAEIEENTINYLVDDCETLKDHLGIKKWKCVLGGSWGVTLAVAYAQAYPSSVGGLVLRGVCLMRSKEIDWLFGDNVKSGGASLWNPDAWNLFQSLIPEEELSRNAHNTGRSVLTAYHDRFMGSDLEERIKAARYWSTWEMTMFGFKKDLMEDTPEELLLWDKSNWTVTNHSRDSSTPTDIQFVEKLRRFNAIPPPSVQSIPTPATTSETNNQTKQATQSPSKNNQTSNINYTSYIPVQQMLTCHYSLNNAFMNNDTPQLLENTHVLRDANIPCIAIQGGQDWICPPDTLLDLHNVWKEMEIRVVLRAGHSMYDPGIAREIVKATDRFRDVGGVGE